MEVDDEGGWGSGRPGWCLCSVVTGLFHTEATEESIQYLEHAELDLVGPSPNLGGGPLPSNGKALIFPGGEAFELGCRGGGGLGRRVVGVKQVSPLQSQRK